MKKRIRITAGGIYGAPTEANPSGEYPVGHEFETEADLPAGWVGRAEVLGDDPAEGSVAIVNPATPLDGNVDDLTAYLATVDDADTVQQLIDAETGGKARKGALAALEARRDELLAA